jgi:cysteine desulfurase
MNSTKIYLDYAAATPVSGRAQKVAARYYSDNYYNPSAVYESARAVRKDLEQARAVVASVLGAKDQEIIFTAGGTEANNIAISGVMNKYPEGNAVVSAIEHESVLEPAGKHNVRIVPVHTSGLLDTQKLEDSIDDQTVLVSVMYANNEIGTVQSLKDIAEIIAKKRKSRNNNMPLYFHTDACQAANYLDLQVTRLGVDMMTLNGGKVYGFKQSGCLYVRAGVEIDSFTYGGGQESGVRSGTENVPALVAFATVLQKAQNIRKHEAMRLRDLRDSIFANISQKFPEVLLNGDRKKRLPNNLNICVPGADGERLLMELDELGVMVATGSACTASNDKPSHVLLALGLSEAEASGSIRITLGKPTTEEEVERATALITAAIKAHARLVY